MTQSQTFLRFTTRGLLYVMLGMSVGLAIAFSLLPPLLGITRGQMAMMVGWYCLGCSAFAVPVVLWRFRAERRTGERLLILPISKLKAPSSKFVGLLWLIPSVIKVASGLGDIADSDNLEGAIDLASAGFFGGMAWVWYCWGQSIQSIELGQRGILLGIGRFFPWDMVRTRALGWPDSREPSIEFYCGYTTYRPVMTPADLEEVEAILTQYKPLYAEIGHC